MAILALSENLLPARLQMAFTLGAHIILACFGVGFPVLMLLAEWRYRTTGEMVWKTIAMRWSKAFAVMFAIGAVTGTTLSFELGLLWPHFMGTFGSVIGLAFTLEGFAFFLEAIFIGIYLYGWDRLSSRVHWLTAFPIAISGFASAAFVITVNSWMNTPQGFRMENGRVVDVNPWAAMFNPASGAQAVHMILAAYVVTGFCVAGYYAGSLLRSTRYQDYKIRAMSLGIWLGVVCIPLQILSGDWAAKVVAKTQPVKLAAMEGLYDTTAGAPLTIGGIPNDDERLSPYGIEVPKLLSFLAYADANAKVRGLNDFPREHWPPTLVVHIAFQIMVGCGIFLLLVGVIGLVQRIQRGAFPQSRSYLWLLVLSGPLAILAMETGWTVTEVGRQPWIVQGVMYTRDAVTDVPGVWHVFYMTMGIYIILALATVFALRWIATRPMPEETHGA